MVDLLGINYDGGDGDFLSDPQPLASRQRRGLGGAIFQPAPPAQPAPASAPVEQPQPQPAPAPTPLGRLGLVSRVPESELAPGPQQQRLAQMAAAPPPQLHGWKRGLDIAGQILAPGLERAIPGSAGYQATQLGRQKSLADIEAEQQKSALGRRDVASQITERGARAEKELREPAVAASPEDRQAWASKFGLDLEDPQTKAYILTGTYKPESDTAAREFQLWQRQHPGAPVEDWMQLKLSGKGGPKVNYDQGIPVSISTPSGTFDVNDPALPEQYKGLREAAIGAHRQAVSEQQEAQGRRESFQQAQQGRQFSEMDRRQAEREAQLTSTTRTMVEAAPKVKQFVDRITPMIDRLQGKLGPGAGRWSDFWTGKVGLADPEYSKLRTDYGLLQTLLMRMHMGARGSEYAMQHFADLVNMSKQSPENMKAALEEMNRYADDLVEEGKQGIGPAAVGRLAPAAGGGGKGGAKSTPTRPSPAAAGAKPGDPLGIY